MPACFYFIFCYLWGRGPFSSLLQAILFLQEIMGIADALPVGLQGEMCVMKL